MSYAGDDSKLNSENSELCDKMAVVAIRLSCEAQRVRNDAPVSEWGPIVPIAHKVYYSLSARQLTSLDRIAKRAADDWLANLNRGLGKYRWAVSSAVQCDMSCRIVRMP